MRIFIFVVLIALVSCAVPGRDKKGSSVGSFKAKVSREVENIISIFKRVLESVRHGGNFLKGMKEIREAVRDGIKNLNQLMKSLEESDSNEKLGRR